MTNVPLTVIPEQKSEKEEVSLKSPAKKEARTYVAEKLELSDGIKKFDLKISKKTVSPYDYNSISLNRKPSMNNRTATEMITDPLYNTVGKFLGVDTLHDWGKDYDKVETIVNWAKKKTGSDKISRLVDFLNGAYNFAPTFGINHRKLDQVHLIAKLQLSGQ